jgi:hypothetical protein
MKIEYGTETIGDDSAGDFISPAVARGHARALQMEQLFRGAAEATFARGNIRNTIQFAVEKEHATAEDAVIHLFSYPDSLPGSGALRVTEGDTGYEMADACLTAVDLVALTGRSTTMRFSFTGGAITESQ